MVVMRAIAVLVVLASGSAWADRAPVWTIGGVIDLRFVGHTWDSANKQDTPTVAAGPRVMLTFEDPLLPKPPKGKVSADARLVPELFAGANFDATVGEGYAGAGVRGEIDIASWRARLAMYMSARGFVIGLHRDGAGEFAVGEYIHLADHFRFGWEAAAVVRPQDREGDRELDCDVTMYVGWRR
jgi:hypothetical protein